MLRKWIENLWKLAVLMRVCVVKSWPKALTWGPSLCLPMTTLLNAWHFSFRIAPNLKLGMARVRIKTWRFLLNQTWTDEVPRFAWGFSPAGRNDVTTVRLGGGEISPRVTFADNCKISLARRNILSFTCPSIITMGLFKNWARKGDQISTSEDPYAIEIKFAARRNL